MDVYQPDKTKAYTHVNVKQVAMEPSFEVPSTTRTLCALQVQAISSMPKLRVNGPLFLEIQLSGNSGERDDGSRDVEIIVTQYDPHAMIGSEFEQSFKLKVKAGQSTLILGTKPAARNNNNNNNNNNNKANSSCAQHQSWSLSSTSATILPGTRHKIQVCRNLPDGSTLCSYPLTVTTPTFIPALATNVAVNLAHTDTDRRIRVKFDVPHHGGAPVEVVHVVAYCWNDSVQRLVLCGEVRSQLGEDSSSTSSTSTSTSSSSSSSVNNASTNSSSMEVVVHTPVEWMAKRCYFGVRLKNAVGWNVPSRSVISCEGAPDKVAVVKSNTMTSPISTMPSLLVPAAWQVVRLKTPDVVKLQKCLKGKSFGTSIDKCLRQWRLAPLSMPFGKVGLTIMDWVKREVSAVCLV